MAKGYANGQIADALAIAEGTVKNNLMNIYQKLGVHSYAEALAWVWQHDKTQQQENASLEAPYLVIYRQKGSFCAVLYLGSTQAVSQITEDKG